MKKFLEALAAIIAVWACLPETTAVQEDPAAVVAAGQLTFSTFLGGAGSDQVRDMATDAQGNVYVTGGTRSSNFPTTSGAYDRSFNGNTDIFVAKFTAAGQLVWSTFIGGPNYDRAYAIELDPAGNIVIAGRASVGLPGRSGFFDPTFGGGALTGSYGQQDGFVCKLSGDGRTLHFCGYIGTADNNITRDVAVDASGNIYAIYMAEQSGIASAWTATGAKPNYTKGAALIVKISPDGRQILGGTWFGAGYISPTGSIRWHGNRVFYASSTTNPSLPTPNGFDHSLSGPTDMFLAVFSDDLTTLHMATYVGGSGGEQNETHNLAVDASGAVIAAATTSATIPGALGTLVGGTDAFVMRISSTGTLMGARLLGGSLYDTFQGVDLDASGRVFLSTITMSSNFPMTQFFGTRVGGSAGLVVLSSDLRTVLFSQFLGGGALDESRSIAVSGTAAFLGGTTQSSNWYRVNAYQGTYRGSMDGTVFRFAGL
jgi:hypothetical protein